MSIQGELDRAEKDLFNGNDAVDILVNMMDRLEWGKNLQFFFYDAFTNDPSYYDSQAIEDGFVEIDFTLLGGQN